MALEPQSEPTFIYHSLVGQYTSMACYTLAFFEWIITLDLEIDLIWTSGWGFAKVAFLVNRYLTVVDFALTYIRQHGPLPIGACKSMYVGEGCIYLVALYFAEYTFALRTCAVWNMNKRMIIALTVFYLGSFTYNAYNYLGSVALLHYFSDRPVPPLFACSAFQEKVSKIYVSYIILVVYDSVMLALMIYPTVKEYRRKDGVTTNSDLFKTIYTEGVLFYAYLLILSSTALAVEVQVPDNNYLFTLVNRVVRSMLSCRVLLNIRKLYAKQQTESLSTERHQSRISSIRFT